MKITLAQLILKVVELLGPKHAFTLTGGMAMYLNNAVHQSKKIKPVYCQHEQACVAAAEGYAKTKDFKIPGLAVVTAGPGVSNCVTSLISAYGDSTPLIVLAGQIKEEDIDKYGTRTHGIQEINSESIISPIVKKFIRLNIDHYESQIVDALTECLSGRKGPVFIEIPLNIQGRLISTSESHINNIHQKIIESINHQDTSINENDQKIIQYFNKLLAAKKPVIYLGNGIRISEL